MKKLRKILLIVLAVVAALVLALTAYFFIGVNRQYFFDLRSQAIPYNRGVLKSTPAEGSVRIKMEWFDGSADWIEFSADRQYVSSKGITPIHFDRRNFWGIWSYEDFVAEYGDYHVDIGDNVFWPSWFTDDGYLIALWCGGERWLPISISNLGEVWVYDLLAAPE